MIPDIILTVFQSVASLPIRQWTIQDVILIAGVLINMAGFCGIGAVALYRIGGSEKGLTRITHRVETNEAAYERDRLDLERRLAITMESVKAAHHRLDGSGPPIDWPRLLAVTDKLMDSQIRRESKVDDILAELTRRSK